MLKNFIKKNYLSISIVISAILVAFITALISGVLPALSAMRLNVVDALRKN